MEANKGTATEMKIGPDEVREKRLTRPETTDCQNMKYFRYCAPYVSPHTNQRYGIFIAVWHLVRNKKLSAEEEAAYWKARAWFEANLPIPPFHKTGNQERAITWFKETAMDSAVVQELQIYREIATRNGTEIDLISSESPGTIIYEDEFQIATIQK